MVLDRIRFQLYEEERDMVADLLPDNSERRKKQKEQDIKVDDRKSTIHGRSEK